MFEDSVLEGLAKSTAMPMFLGEFSFPPSYSLPPGYEVYASANATDDGDAGVQYESNLQSAARNLGVSAWRGSNIAMNRCRAGASWARQIWIWWKARTTRSAWWMWRTAPSTTW